MRRKNNRSAKKIHNSILSERSECEQGEESGFARSETK